METLTEKYEELFVDVLIKLPGEEDEVDWDDEDDEIFDDIAGDRDDLHIIVEEEEDFIDPDDDDHLPDDDLQ